MEGLFGFFPGKGVGPGFSLSGQAFSLVPGVSELRVGGLKCRKNAVF